MPRTVVVTGAESGISAACAAAFGAEGDWVAVSYYADADRAELTATAASHP
jgi:glucose 1-dehydrogenase